MIVSKSQGRLTRKAEKMLELLAKDKEDSVRGDVAGNPNTPGAILQLLSKDKDEGVRVSVAGNLNTPIPFLELLARDKEEGVRMSVAKNPNVPVAVLKLLSKDKEEWVRDAALKSLANDQGEDVQHYDPDDILTILTPAVKITKGNYYKTLTSTYPNYYDIVKIVLKEIITYNLDYFKKEETFKVRPGYGPDKFYLNSIDGSYESSLNNLIHHILYEEKIYKELLNTSQYHDVIELVKRSPDSIYYPEDDDEEYEGIQSMLDEIYGECISFVAHTLKSRGFKKNLLMNFKTYMEERGNDGW